MAFNWFQKWGAQKEAAKVVHIAARPIVRDLTEQFVVNADLTRGIWHNTVEALKLAGGLAYAPIAVPIAFMGLPIPKTIEQNEAEDLELARVVDEHCAELREIHLQCHREGTIWIWPYFNARKGRVLWEFIPDESIPSMIKDLQGGELQKIFTDEMLLLQIDDTTQAQVRRRRTFAPKKIEITYEGQYQVIDEKIADRTYVNPIGILPIPFANEADGDEKRGHSDYERILSDLKAYHDLEFATLDLLARFRAKLALTVNDVEAWKANNPQFGSDLSSLDLSTSDLFFLMPEETIEVIFPEGAHESYDAEKKNIFRKLVEETGIPEIAWGVKTTGNHATTEEQMAVLVRKVEDKRQQKNAPYKRLFVATRQLETLAGFGAEVDPGNVEVQWNLLDSVSDSVRSEIFERFTQGVSKLISSAGATMAQLYKLWQLNFPQATEEDFEDWKVNLAETVAHKRMSGASVLDLLDAAGDEPEDRARPGEDEEEDEEEDEAEEED